MGDDWILIRIMIKSRVFSHPDIIDEVVTWRHLRRVRLSTLLMVQWSIDYYVVVVSLPLKLSLSVVTYMIQPIESERNGAMRFGLLLLKISVCFCSWSWKFGMVCVSWERWPHIRIMLQILAYSFSFLMFFCVPFWCWKDTFSYLHFLGNKIILVITTS